MRNSKNIGEVVKELAVINLDMPSSEKILPVVLSSKDVVVLRY
jgi:hypothetical protein